MGGFVNISIYGDVCARKCLQRFSPCPDKSSLNIIIIITIIIIVIISTSHDNSVKSISGPVHAFCSRVTEIIGGLESRTHLSVLIPLTIVMMTVLVIDEGNSWRVAFSYL